MKCPHCTIDFFPDCEEEFITSAKGKTYSYEAYICPSCEELTLILSILKGENMEFPDYDYSPSKDKDRLIKSIQVFPYGSSRPPCPPEVDEKYKDDYIEACIVLNISPKASAALSRRCLHNLLIEKVGTKSKNLESQIDEAMTIINYPSSISDLLHALRHIGNFSAHPKKDKSTGEIIDIESGEAEICLEVLESLFDYHFVIPIKNKKRKEELNKKLAAAGKPLLK